MAGSASSVTTLVDWVPRNLSMSVRKLSTTTPAEMLSARIVAVVAVTPHGEEREEEDEEGAEENAQTSAEEESGTSLHEEAETTEEE